MDVPLCKEDCHSWWEDCKDDFTCKTNWHKGWDWSSGNYEHTFDVHVTQRDLSVFTFPHTGINKCPTHRQCRKWIDVFPTPKSMCEQIWSNSYLYTTHTKTSGRCMQLWFTGKNPNKKVAEYYLLNDVQRQRSFKFTALLLLCVSPLFF